MDLQTLQRLRIGLVLSGGGAKGAYEVGSWRALRKAGVTNFTAIAGTSVGALNAILISLGKYESAESLWRNLRFNTVLRFKPLKFLLLPFWLFITLYRLRGAPIRRATSFTMSFSMVVALWALVQLWYCIPVFEATSGRYFLGARLILILVATYGFLDYFSPLVKWIVLNWMCTTNTPLATRLEGEVKPDDLKRLTIPTYATLSRFHPDLLPDGLFWQGWIPEYVRLNDLSHRSILEVLLQSAGLPGVFPVKPALGEEAIDGGWCDNVPAAPILYADGNLVVDLVFVIHLNPDDLRPPQGLFKVVNRPIHFSGVTGAIDTVQDAGTNWHSHLKGVASRATTTSAAAAPVAPAGDVNNTPPPRETPVYVDDGPVFMRISHSAIAAADEAGQLKVRDEVKPDPHREANRRPAPRLIHVFPSANLGNFLTGTLWFSGPKAVRLMDLGEVDMAREITKLLVEDDPPPEYHQELAAEASQRIKRQGDYKDQEAYWVRAHALYNFQAWADALEDFRTLAWLSEYRPAYPQLRIWLIEARLGRRDAASQELLEFAAKHQTTKKIDPWETYIIRFLLGQLDEDQLFNVAKSIPSAEGQRCLGQALFYAGTQRLISSDTRTAKQYFEQTVAAAPPMSPERMSALAELRLFAKRGP